MRRKSERNKAKGSPEKKLEKPTRKSTRRRGRRATSSSPERDDSQEDTTSDASLSRESNKDSTRLQTKELKSIPEKSEPVILTQEIVDKDSSPETEDNGSVWKVARADASPGEIQKLKLCRQRNISETSDNSSSRKRSHKWQGSGEGVTEEVDSNDERLGSPRVEPGGKRSDDASSIPPGQDSNQEVSDYKETLLEPTSANLSDDKPNIDLQGDSNEASCSNLSNDIKSDPIDTSADLISYRDDAAEAVPRLQEIMTVQVDEIYNQECQQITQDAEITEKNKKDLEGKGEPSSEKEDLGKQISDQDQGTPQEKEELEREDDASVIEKEILQREGEIKEIKEQHSQEHVPEKEEQALQQEIPKLEEQMPSKEDSPEKEEEFSQAGDNLQRGQSPQVEEGSPETQQEKEEQVPEKEEATLQNNQDIPQNIQNSPQRDELTTTEKNDPKDSSSDNEREREKIEHSDSNSNSETQVKISSIVRTSSRSTRRKHRNKYRDSSNSDTPDSEDEPFLERQSKQSETPEEEVPRQKDRSRSKSLEPRKSSPLLNSQQRDNEVEDVEKQEQKVVDSTNDKKSITDLSTITTSSQKPAKINLKRTL